MYVQLHVSSANIITCLHPFRYIMSRHMFEYNMYACKYL